MKKLLWLSIGLLISQTNIPADPHPILDWSSQPSSRSESPVSEGGLFAPTGGATMATEAQMEAIRARIAAEEAAAAAVKAHTTAASAHADASDAHATAAEAHTAAAAARADAPLTAEEQAAFDRLFDDAQSEEKDDERETPPFRPSTPGKKPVDGPNYTPAPSRDATPTARRTIEVGDKPHEVYQMDAAAAAARASAVAADASDLAQQAATAAASAAGASAAGDDAPAADGSTPGTTKVPSLTTADMKTEEEMAQAIETTTDINKKESLLKRFYQWLIEKNWLKSWAQGKLTNLYIDDAMVTLSPQISADLRANKQALINIDNESTSEELKAVVIAHLHQDGLTKLIQNLKNNNLLTEENITKITTTLQQDAQKSLKILQRSKVIFHPDSIIKHIDNFIQTAVTDTVTSVNAKQP